MSEQIKYAIAGGAGYIARKHVEAISKTGGEVVVLIDHSSSVGYIDQYFKQCRLVLGYYQDRTRGKEFIEYGKPSICADDFFTNLKNKDNIDYLVVCTPNDTHSFYIQMALKYGMKCICEKPLTINEYEVNAIDSIYKEARKDSLFVIHQLRLHPEYKNLLEYFVKKDQQWMIGNFDYIAPRGEWYKHTWKNQNDRSGGLLFNIGIHMFDMLFSIFGIPRTMTVKKETDGTRGVMSFAGNNTISYTLSTEPNYDARRCLTFQDGTSFDFTKFTEQNLHVESYKEILAGRGNGFHDVEKTIKYLYHKTF